MAADQLGILTKLFHRFGDANEKEALNALRQFRRLCTSNGVKPVDYILAPSANASQARLDELLRVLDRLNAPVAARITELEAILREKDAAIIKLAARLANRKGRVRASRQRK